MHQNVTLAEAVVLSCFRFDGERRRVVYEEGELPVGPLPLPGAGPKRRGDRRRAGRRGRRGRRSTSARCSCRSRTSSSGPAEIQDVEAIVARAHEAGALVVLDAYQSVGTVPLDVTALGRRLRRRGLGQVALRRARAPRWLYVRPGPGGDARAGAHRLAGARAAVRLRAGAGLRGGRVAIPHRNAERPRALRRDRRLRRDRGGRGRANPRALARADPAARRLARGSRARSREPARSGAARRHGRRRRARTPSASDRELVARGILCDWRPEVGLRLGPHFFNRTTSCASPSSRSASSQVRS